MKFCIYWKIFCILRACLLSNWPSLVSPICLIRSLMVCLINKLKPTYPKNGLLPGKWNTIDWLGKLFTYYDSFSNNRLRSEERPLQSFAVFLQSHSLLLRLKLRLLHSVNYLPIMAPSQMFDDSSFKSRSLLQLMYLLQLM